MCKTGTVKLIKYPQVGIMIVTSRTMAPENFETFIHILHNTGDT